VRLFYDAHTLFLTGEACEGVRFFNEADLMYPEAAIKTLFPKVLSQNIEITNKVSSVFDKRISLKMKP
jgi:hypothetical protein